MLKKLINYALNVLLPQKCAGCGRPAKKKEDIFCQKCLDGLEYEGYYEQNVFAAAPYHEPAIKKAVWLLKYKGVKIMARPLGNLLAERFEKIMPNRDKNWVIVPAPLHKKRFKERGYNQAELIAKVVSEKLGVPLLDGAVMKERHTESQVDIKNRTKRLANLTGAFVLKNAEAVKGKNVLIVDDVSTTGATISEIRKLLRSAGARKVLGLVVAHG